MLEYYRRYANAFEIAVQDYEDDECYKGWTALVRKDKKLLATVIDMIENRDNEKGKKLAVLNCKHPKPEIRYLCDKIMKGEKFDVVDRTETTL
ncbi:MAG: hypothetical protein ACOC1K_02545 [Nanoarchaeota archaeon]